MLKKRGYNLRRTLRVSGMDTSRPCNSRRVRYELSTNYYRSLRQNILSCKERTRESSHRKRRHQEPPHRGGKGKSLTSDTLASETQQTEGIPKVLPPHTFLSGNGSHSLLGESEDRTWKLFLLGAISFLQNAL